MNERSLQQKAPPTEVQRSAARKRRQRRERIQKGIITVLLVLFAVYFLFPFVWMISVSLQTEQEVMTTVGFWDQLIPDSWRFENYKDVFKTIPFGRYFMNSAIVTGLTVIGTVCSSSVVAYAFAKLRWPGRSLCYSVMLLTMMIPASILMIPTYKMYSAMGLTNSWVPLILPSFLGGGAGNIILIEQFYRSVPREMLEASRIDGASEWKILMDILVPLSKPVLATVAVFAFLFAWNDYLGPLLYVNDQNLITVALGLRSFQSQSGTNWALLMAGSVISMIPSLLIFVFCQKYFLEGVKTGAVKG